MYIHVTYPHSQDENIHGVPPKGGTAQAQAVVYQCAKFRAVLKSSYSVRAFSLGCLTLFFYLLQNAVLLSFANNSSPKDLSQQKNPSAVWRLLEDPRDP